MRNRNSEMTPTHTLRVFATLETQFEQLRTDINIENDDYPVLALLRPSFLKESDFNSLFQYISNSAVPARLGLKAAALAWLLAAPAFQKFRPSQGSRLRLGFGLAWPEPRLYQ
jgi:hypothetical protein